jgi:large subunit ribosomal protein L22
MADKKPQTITEVKAFARYIHVSPQKLRLVANLVRKTPVETALEQLRFSSKNAALPLMKAINSAVANAVHNFNLNKDELYVKAITIDGGPVLKRYAPRAQGRAFIERKRTSHISVILEPRKSKAKLRRSVFSFNKKSDEQQVRKVEQPESGEVKSNKPQGPKQAGRADDKMKMNKISLKRRLFNRKSGE